MADRRYLASRGLSGDFIARIYSTPHTETWQPTHAELLRAGAVTSVAMTPGEEAELRQFLAAHRLYGVIRVIRDGDLCGPRGESARKQLQSSGQLEQFYGAMQPFVTAAYVEISAARVGPGGAGRDGGRGRGGDSVARGGPGPLLPLFQPESTTPA